MRNTFTFLFLAFFTFCGFAQNTFQNAAVVSAHPLASEIGLQILQQGGNAYDAAIAVEFALAVCLPAAGNIGGGGFIVLRHHDGTLASLDYRERAPLSAKANMFLDDDGNPIDSLSRAGILSAGVPGTVAGMWKLHREFGTLPWRTLVEPAIKLASEGVVLTEKEAKMLNENAEQFRQYNFHPIAYLNPEGKAWQKGDEIKHPDFAKTLLRIAAAGKDGFYTGLTADLMLEAAKILGANWAQADLDAYEAIWRPVLKIQYKEYELASMGPPSSGGIILSQMLTMAATQPIQKWHPTHPKYIHFFAEASKIAYADRSKWLGDPDYVQVPVAELVNDSTLKARFKKFKAGRSKPANVSPLQIDDYESTETTHYAIVDAFGNAVSATTTLNGRYGSYVVVPGAGFLLNNELDDFSAKPGTPNSYGLIGSKANAISPGKRPLSSMTPTIVTKNNQLFMVVGTPGGSTIPTSVFQTLMLVFHFNKTMQDAVAQPRMHHQWKPDEIKFEEHYKADADIKKVESLGYKIVQKGFWGRVEGIRRKPDGSLETGADPRGDDTAVGY